MNDLQLEISLKRTGKSSWLAFLSVLIGALGVVLVLFIPTIMKIQPSILLQVQWPVIALTLLLIGTCVWLLLKVRWRYNRNKLLLIAGATLALGLILFEFTVYYAQDKIIYMQPKLTIEGKDYITNTFQNVEEISIKTDDQITLKGWLIRNSQEKQAPLMIYFGGNNENVPPNFLSNLTGLNIAFVNYRGYGLSGGTPSEITIKADGLTIYDTLAQYNYVDNQKIIISGRSLGSGVATYVSSKRAVMGVIFISPYDNMIRVVQDLFPIFPSMLARNHFNSIELAPSISSPVLSFIGEKDETVIPQRSDSLLNQWAGEKQFVYIPGANHNNILTYPIISEETKKFLIRISGIN